MGKNSGEKGKTEIELKMDRVLLMRKVDKTKLKIAKKLGRQEGIVVQAGNIGETAIRKLQSEIIPQFRKAGIDFWENNIVTKAVMEQIMMYSKKGESFLDEFNHSLIARKSKEKLQLQHTNRFSRILAKMKAFLNPKEKNDEQDDLAQAKQKISSYEEAIKKLENYNLNENIIETILDQICPEKGVAQLGCFVPKLINDEIAPTLSKLGLGHLIPEIHAQLKERYKRIEGENSFVAEACKMPQFEYMPDSFENEGIEPGED